MTTQLDLFETRYPAAPGYRRTETSRSAAKGISPFQLQSEILTVLSGGFRGFRTEREQTPDEIADVLQRDRHSVRSGCSELKALGKIKPTGERRPNASGKMADVLGVVG